MIKCFQSVFYFLILLSLFINGCISNENKVSKTNEDSTQIILELKSEILGLTKVNYQITNNDTNQIIVTEESQDSLKYFILDILDELIVEDTTMIGCTWYGLFKLENELFEIKAINVDAEFRMEPCLEIKEILLTMREIPSPLFLLSGDNLLNNQKIKSCFYNTVSLRPHDTNKIPNTNLIIITDSTRRIYNTMNDYDSGYEDILLTEYKLVVKQKDINQLLLKNACGTPEIWCGCLDNDTIPDIILSAFEDKFLTRIIVLFLSQGAGENKLYKNVAKKRIHMGPC